MGNLFDEIKEIRTGAQLAVESCASEKELEQAKINLLGKKSNLMAVLKQMGSLLTEERTAVGRMANDTRGFIERLISERAELFKNKAIDLELKTGMFDVTLPLNKSAGTLHPITIVQREIEDIFKTMGFTIEGGFEIETEYNNFESLNIPKYHPARDMQDTYYLDNGQLLKTHTSAAQNRIMKKYGAPLKALFPGRCFRNESTDASHENTFFQMEGMMVGEEVSISNLIYFMKGLLTEVFKKEVKVRLRPGFFPFVEPGFELDINCLICGGNGCQTCHHSGWLELLPCGMIHPNVLEMGGIDSEKYTGLAFGLGLTRLTMMKYGIKDIRILNTGNLKILKQFVM